MTVVVRDTSECHLKILKMCVNLGKNDKKLAKNKENCINLGEKKSEFKRNVEKLASLSSALFTYGARYFINHLPT